MLICAAALMLSACGFQLRGQQDYVFKRLAIVGMQPRMAARLTRIIEGSSDTVITNSLDNADAVLYVSESRSLNTLTLNALGVVEEYQLNYSLNYKLVSKTETMLIGPSIITLNHTMNYSTQSSPMQWQEFDLLYIDMQNDAVDQLTHALAAIHTSHPMKIQPRATKNRTTYTPFSRPPPS